MDGTLEAGAVGYLLKDEAPEKIVEAVRAAANGQGWFSSTVTAKMEDWERGDAPSLRKLTARDIEVLRLVVKGKTNKRIGKSLGISDKAVEKHLSEIFAKLNVSSRTAAAAWAVREGLG